MMLSRSSISQKFIKAVRRQSCGQRIQRRGLAAAASGSFQYETREELGVKCASRDLPGPTTTLTLVAKAGTRYQTQPGYSDALEKFAFKVRQASYCSDGDDPVLTVYLSLPTVDLHYESPERWSSWVVSFLLTILARTLFYVPNS